MNIIIKSHKDKGNKKSQSAVKNRTGEAFGEIDPDHSPIPVGFDSPLVTFTNLLSNYEYSIVVKSIYDLDDGTLPGDLKPQNIYSGFATTLEKSRLMNSEECCGISRGGRLRAQMKYPWKSSKNSEKRI